MVLDNLGCKYITCNPVITKEGPKRGEPFQEIAAFSDQTALELAREVEDKHLVVQFCEAISELSNIRCLWPTETMNTLTIDPLFPRNRGHGCYSP